jgi:uncharacterized Zn-finger protein
MPEPSPTPPAAAARSVHVRPDELPMSCPTPAMALWNSHPRVYLPLAENGRARCPYCGAEYVLVDGPAA